MKIDDFIDNQIINYTLFDTIAVMFVLFVLFGFLIKTGLILVVLLWMFIHGCRKLFMSIFEYLRISKSINKQKPLWL